METTTTPKQQSQSSSLPASKKRHRAKHSTDSFLALSNASIPSSSPSPSANDASSTEQEEPLYWRIIATPFLFTSFLLSLFLIDTRNANLRNASHSSFLGFLAPQPYQDPHNSTWARRDSAHSTTPDPVLGPSAKHQRHDDREKRSWHLHAKIRKMARLEISDAFEMRKRVMVAMGLAMVGLAWIVWCCIRWMLSWVW